MSRHTSRSLNETAHRALEFCWITNTSIRVVYQRFFECITTSAFIQTRSVLGNLTCMVENTDKPLFKQQLNSCISLPCNGVKWTWDKNQTQIWNDRSAGLPSTASITPSSCGGCAQSHFGNEFAASFERCVELGLKQQEIKILTLQPLDCLLPVGECLCQ